jgi:hypothetical protein
MHLSEHFPAPDVLTTVHMTASVEQQLGLPLTATFRDELAELMAQSDTPEVILRLGTAIYDQAIRSGDTSVCVEVLQRAARPYLTRPAESATDA